MYSLRLSTRQRLMKYGVRRRVLTILTLGRFRVFGIIGKFERYELADEGHIV